MSLDKAYTGTSKVDVSGVCYLIEIEASRGFEILLLTLWLRLGRVHMLRRVAHSRRSFVLVPRYNNRLSGRFSTREHGDFSTQNSKMGEAQEHDAFEKMEQEGVPKCPEPTRVATEAKIEEPELPKLSPQEFRQWNHMSEHMDMFVSTPSPILFVKLRLIYRYLA